MSGIAGILARRRDAQAGHSIAIMLASMRHRGPDGLRHWAGGSVALGHAWLDTTGAPDFAMLGGPEPRYVATADMRLDNRETLIGDLSGAADELSDADLLLRAFGRWGQDCVDHLLGDFAFAIWDAERREMFCARDHSGVRPFHYVDDEACFAFASEIRALVAVGAAHRSLDEKHVSAFLAGLPLDAEQTPFRAIKRLPAGHAMVVGRRSAALRRYWTPAAMTLPAGDRAAQFGEIFTDAVTARMRGPASMGALLSGGLDSSSICRVAAKARQTAGAGPLPTFSASFPGCPELDEQAYAQAVIAQGGLDGSFVEISLEAPFDHFDRMLDEQEGTFVAPGIAVIRSLYEAAGNTGIRVLLDGHGGDEVTASGERRPYELASQHRWLKLWRELRGMARVQKTPLLKPFLRLFHHYGIRPVMPALSLPGRNARGQHGVAAASADIWKSYLDPQFVSRTTLAERYRSARAAPLGAATDDNLWHRWRLSAPLVSHAFEVLGRAGAAAGLEPRFPFWDKRLVEFCLALPSHEKLQDGWTRPVLRRAMEGILPRSVQWRRDKTDFTPGLVRGMARSAPSLRALLMEEHGLGEFLDVKRAVAAIDRIAVSPADVHPFEVKFIWRTISLGHWLRQMNAARP